MFCVIFVVHPKPSRKDTYLELAKLLKPELERIEGFLGNERSASSTRDGFILSLSSWRDEKALIRWRTQSRHHEVQLQGRNEVFDDYHLRISEVVADEVAGHKRLFAGTRLDETEVGQDKACVISEYTYADETAFKNRAQLHAPVNTTGFLKSEIFSGITNPLREVMLTEWSLAKSADMWHPGDRSGCAARHRHVRVIRDYAMHDRREAPQYYPPVELMNN